MGYAIVDESIEVPMMKWAAGLFLAFYSEVNFDGHQGAETAALPVLLATAVCVAEVAVVVAVVVLSTRTAVVVVLEVCLASS